MNIHKIRRKRILKNFRILMALAIIFFLSILFALYIGSIHVPVLKLFSLEYRPILIIRILRVFLGILAGAALSIVGATLQALFRNPLAEPYTLGISGGAALGAVIAIVLGVLELQFGIYLLPLIAFLSGLCSMIIVYNIARTNGKIPINNLLLAGVMVGIVTSSILIVLLAFSPNERLHSFLWWLLGNLQIYEVSLIIPITAIVLVGSFVIFLFSGELNIVSLGEEEAHHLGLNPETIKKVLFFICCFIIGALVSVCGMIGFVGLIVPHGLRLIVGPDHRLLLPASFLGGAAFLILCDAIGRAILSPIEMPVGAITALIGGPLFLIIMHRYSRLKTK